MDYVYNLTWPQARELTKQGSRVRRANWTDRWIYRTAGALYWLAPDSGSDRVVRATDFTKAEFLANDWTTMWPDQHECILPSPDPVPDPPPPEPDPQPDPGGPIIKSYTFYKKLPLNYPAVYNSKYGGLLGGLEGGAHVINPFNAFGIACNVSIVGVADDWLWVYRGAGALVSFRAPRTSSVYHGGNSSVPQWDRGWPLSANLVLAPYDSFFIYALDTEGGVATYNVVITLSP